MYVEIAEKAYATLSDVKDCPKNANHQEFITFEEFDLCHLPQDFRNDEVLAFIKNIGQRVVRLTVTKQDGQLLYGSGVVYKVGKSCVILTNDHVVSCEADVKNCTIDFFYHTPGFAGIERCKGSDWIGASNVQDRCYFAFDPVPDRIQNIEMFDYSDLVANVVIRHFDTSTSNSHSYVFLKGEKSFVLIPRDAISNNSNVESVEIAFENSVGETAMATFVAIHYSDEKCVHIEVNDLPLFVKEALLKSWDAPWPTGNPLFTPAVIAHPHGGPKMVTLGKMMSIVAEEGGIVKKLYHTARTCPGSSGGLVLTIGGDATDYLGYASNRCLHCKGERVDEYQGKPTETGNLNVSLFNN